MSPSAPAMAFTTLPFCCLALGVFAQAQFLERRLAEKEDDKKELEALRKEVAYWKFRYGNLLEMYSEVSGVPNLIENLPAEQNRFMPGNVQHCRNSIAAVSPQEGTNPGSDPKLNHSNYSYVVYSPKSRYAIHLRHVFDGADATLETVQNFEFKGQVPAIMFDIDNTLAYTGFNDTDILGKAPPMIRAVDFAKRWCRFDNKSTAKFDCFFLTARYCTQLKAAATKTWVLNNFPVDTEWVREHVFMTGGVGGCDSQGCSIAYKAVLRNWLHSNRRVYWVMSIGDQLTDSAGVQSGIRVKVPNFWFDSSVVANPQGNGGKIQLQPDRSFPEDSDQCKLKCVVGPDHECIDAGLNEDAIHMYTQLEYCMAQDSNKAPDQIKGCTINLLTLQRSC